MTEWFQHLMYFSNQIVEALPSYFWLDMFPRIVPASWVEQSFSINIFTSPNYSLNSVEG